MRVISSLAAAAAVLAFAAPASATIIIDIGAGVLQPEENVLFNNNPTPGFEIEGVTNQTGTFVSFEGGETLVAAGGQARLDSQDTRISSTFTYRTVTNQLVGVDLSDPNLGFTSTEFRLFGGTATQATLTFVDTEGEVFTFTSAIPTNGFFNARAIDGQVIDYFSIATNGSLDDIRQIRLGGVVDVGGGTAIPEPATWAMMIMGFGAAGSILRRRRESTAAA
jgi:hypothetical protein